MLLGEKTFHAKIGPDDESGLLHALFSTFNVIDKDQDVVLPSAFTHGEEVPMVWAHDWQRPIGKGLIEVSPEGAVFKGRFNLATSWGRDAYESVKFTGDQQEYSWGFRITDHAYEKRDGVKVRVIKGAKVYEVSPVLVGAGEGTRTLALKAAAEAALDDLLAPDALKEGRRFSAATLGRLRTIHAELSALLSESARAEAMADDNDEDEKAAETAVSGDLPVNLDAAGAGLAAGLKSYLAIVGAADADAIQRDEGAIVGVKRRLSQALDDLDRHLTRATADGPTPQALKRRFDYLARIGPPR